MALEYVFVTLSQIQIPYWHIAVVPVIDAAIKMLDYPILCNAYESKGEVTNDQWAEMAGRFSAAHVDRTEMNCWNKKQFCTRSSELLEEVCGLIMQACHCTQVEYKVINWWLCHPFVFICMLSSINEYRAGNILVEKYLVFVNIAGNEVPGKYY